MGQFSAVPEWMQEDAAFDGQMILLFAAIEHYAGPGVVADVTMADLALRAKVPIRSAYRAKDRLVERRVLCVEPSVSWRGQGANRYVIFPFEKRMDEPADDECPCGRCSQSNRGMPEQHTAESSGLAGWQTAESSGLPGWQSGVCHPGRPSSLQIEDVSLNAADASPDDEPVDNTTWRTHRALPDGTRKRLADALDVLGILGPHLAIEVRYLERLDSWRDVSERIRRWCGLQAARENGRRDDAGVRAMVEDTGAIWLTDERWTALMAESEGCPHRHVEPSGYCSACGSRVVA